MNNVKYSIVNIDENPTFTNITSNVGTAIVDCKPYVSTWACKFVFSLCKHFSFACGQLQYYSTDDGTLDISTLNKLSSS